MATRPKLTLEEQTAKAKLRALAQGIQIWKLEGAETPMYAVPSTSMDGTAYLLTVHNADSQDITCTCPGNVYRGICKHMGAILVRLDLEAEMEWAQAAADEDRDAAWFDYDRQTWVVNGKYVRCGHRANPPTCNCYGRLHEGETAPPEAIETNAVTIPDRLEKELESIGL